MGTLNRRILTSSALTFIAVIGTGILGGPALAQDGIVINAESKTGIRRQGPDSVTFKSGQAFRARKGTLFPVSVTGRNSALYSCSMSSESVPDLDRAALATWLSGLKSYLPIFLGDAIPARPSRMQIAIDKLVEAEKLPRDVEFASKELKRHLHRLDQLMQGPHGAVPIRLRQLNALDQLNQAGNHFAQIREAASMYDTVLVRIGCPDGKCLQLTPLLGVLINIDATARTLREAISTARGQAVELTKVWDSLMIRIEATTDSLRRLGATMSDPRRQQMTDSLSALEKQAIDIGRLLGPVSATFEDEDKLLEAAGLALADTDNIRTLMLSLKTWHGRIHDADNSLDCDRIEVTADSGRKVALTIAKRDAAETVDLGLERDEFTFGFTVTAARRARFGASLALLAALGAVYPSFAAIDTAGQAKVVEKGDQDFRFNYGLTLGIAVGHAKAVGTDRFVFWPVELTVVPSDNVRAFGVGLAVSYKLAKVGVGMMWSRHDVLAPSNPLESLISSKDDLEIKSSFRQPKVYLSFSLIGLPPFTQD